VVATNRETRGVLFALKLFTRLTKPERLERFYVEIEFLRNQCHHPAVMRVFDAGVCINNIDGETIQYPFVIAEYLPETLATFVVRRNDMVMKLSCGMQLLSALSYLETYKVVHRDIKPQNIFVKDKSCVIGDFGLMKFLDAPPAGDDDVDFFKESLSHGMPHLYRSPDLVKFAKGEGTITTKSDVFQLGLVLAELFTGQKLEKPAGSLTDPVELSEIPYISGKNGGEIQKVIKSMLEQDPETRPSASAVIDRWEGLFNEAVVMCHQLNGQIF
jgi:serine/threonine protein kinase